MTPTTTQKPLPDGDFRFRVSDSCEVPLRGHLLRLRLLEGSPSVRDLRPGHRVRASSPNGDERLIRIVAHSTTGGRMTQKRLDHDRELDILISADDAGTADARIDIGWFVTGPAG